MKYFICFLAWLFVMLYLCGPIFCCIPEVSWLGETCAVIGGIGIVGFIIGVIIWEVAEG